MTQANTQKVPKHCVIPLYNLFFSLLAFLYRLLILLQCAFRKKKKLWNSCAIELRKRRIFCRSIVIFSRFQKHWKKSGSTTTKRIVFSFSLLLIKKLCWGRKWVFFSECIHYSAKKKKLLSENKNGKQFFCATLLTLQKKYISAIKIFAVEFFLCVLLYPFSSYSSFHPCPPKQAAKPFITRPIKKNTVIIHKITK